VELLKVIIISLPFCFIIGTGLYLLRYVKGESYPDNATREHRSNTS
jgi:hypothetical protein